MRQQPFLGSGNENYLVLQAFCRVEGYESNCIARLLHAVEVAQQGHLRQEAGERLPGLHTAVVLGNGDKLLGVLQPLRSLLGAIGKGAGVARAREQGVNQLRKGQVLSAVS